jgi:hypothetical protein
MPHTALSEPAELYGSRQTRCAWAYLDVDDGMVWTTSEHARGWRSTLKSRAS